MPDPRHDIPYLWAALDYRALCEDYPPPPAFFDRVYRLPRQAMRELQEERFLRQVARAWEIPFFQRHWGSAGLSTGDIRCLDDLRQLPPYTVDHIRDSIARKPPFGDFIGLSPEDGRSTPLVLQTSGGTTGLPRPMLYAPVDREVMAIMAGRRLAMNGALPGDLIQVTYSLGLSNGGLGQREAIWRYSGCVPVMTGSGVTTPTRRQVEIAQAWGVKCVLGFPAYLRHMAVVARDELGIDVRDLGIRMLGSHLGMEDRATIEELWGAPCYDSYGTHEAGLIATECAEKSGLHLHEDAVIVEILDPDTGEPVADGERGSMHITTLYKHAAPLIRFNVNDISSFVQGTCACGSTLRRLERIFGRGDNMIKLRGINVFPEAIGALLAKDSRCNGEFFCLVDRVGEAGVDRMTVMVESVDAAVDREALQRDLERRLKEGLGVRVVVEPVGRGELDRHTGLTSTSKIKRVRDRRAAPG